MGFRSCLPAAFVFRPLSGGGLTSRSRAAHTDAVRKPELAASRAFLRRREVLRKRLVEPMPHWGGIIPDEDLAALVAYLKTLK